VSDPSLMAWFSVQLSAFSDQLVQKLTADG
jgi:hypothetical protein